MEIKKLGDYDDLHVQRDSLLLADVIENVRNMCLKIYKFNKQNFFEHLKAALKKSKVRLGYLTGIDMLIVEKGLRGGICHYIYWYAEANNKYIKDYDKTKECPYIKYWDVNNLCGSAMSQKLPVNNFKWIDIFHKKTIMKKVMKDISLKLMLNIVEIYIIFIIIYHFYQEEWTFKKLKSL